MFVCIGGGGGCVSGGSVWSQHTCIHMLDDVSQTHMTLFVDVKWIFFPSTGFSISAVTSAAHTETLCQEAAEELKEYNLLY